VHDLELVRLVELHLRPLTREQSEQFVHNWFRIVETSLAIDQEQGRIKAETAANKLVTTLREPGFRTARVATLTRNPQRREGKVYVDFVQNGHGRLLVAPFTVRPKPGAPVSAPLKWSEVNKRLKIENHTIKSVPKRMRRMGEDPLRPVLDVEPDLLGALQRLTTWFD